LFPTTTARESFDLIRILLQKRGMPIPDTEFGALEPSMPLLLTPGAAEALAVKIYRQGRPASCTPIEALRTSLVDYQNPLPLDTLQFQIRLAVSEATHPAFPPPPF